jgi:hypothetical protein
MLEYLKVREAYLSLCVCLSAAGDAARVEEVSLEGELFQLASRKPVEGEALHNGVSAQQSEAPKEEEEVEVPQLPADKPDAPYSPREPVVNPGQPPLDESGASTPTEPAAEKHNKNLCESTSAINPDDQHAQTPETTTVSSRKLGSEPAPRHMESLAELTIEEGEYRPSEFNWNHMASVSIHLTR